MSTNRDVDLDREATRAVLAGERESVDGRANWLGHRVGSGAARIDELLVIGATKDEIAAARGGGDDHLRHLRETHGLPLAEVNGVWMFDRSALGVTDSTGNPAQVASVIPTAPMYDAVLLTGSDEELNDYIEDSGKCLVVDWRSDEGDLTEDLAELLPDGLLSGEWQDEGDVDLYVTYRNVRHKVGLRLEPADRYRWLRRMNELMAGEYELRGFRHTLRDDTHCFLVASCEWWAAMDAALPKETQRVFAKITKRSRFS